MPVNPDQLRSQLPHHVVGMVIAANALLRKIDEPGMTIDQLSETKASADFRHHAHAMSLWLNDAIAAERRLSQADLWAIRKLVEESS